MLVYHHKLTRGPLNRNRFSNDNKRFLSSCLGRLSKVLVCRISFVLLFSWLGELESKVRHNPRQFSSNSVSNLFRCNRIMFLSCVLSRKQAVYPPRHRISDPFEPSVESIHNATGSIQSEERGNAHC